MWCSFLVNSKTRNSPKIVQVNQKCVNSFDVDCRYWMFLIFAFSSDAAIAILLAVVLGIHRQINYVKF